MTALEPTATGPDGTRWFTAAGPSELTRAACERIATAAARAIRARGQFRIVLAGGTTPRGIYRRLRDADLDWPRWQVFFGDERCLPSDDADRNSRMAADALLDHVPVAASGVHPIPAELGAKAAATAYAETLRAVDLFDLVLLGLGEDGHTASLFPGQDWGIAPLAPSVLAVHDAPKPPAERVSLSAWRLGRARAVLFLVSGESKRWAVRQWREGRDIPARSVRLRHGVDVMVEAGLLAD